jgi:mannonate dehydratase
MRLAMRWFGEADSIPLQYVAQVPCIHGIVGTLEDMPVGDVWPLERLQAFKSLVESEGLTLDVIESIPVPEAIKLGLTERDSLIEAYCQSIRHMGQAGIRVLCYNFMPVFDWMRTEMAHVLEHGATATGYTHQAMLDFDLSKGIEARTAWAKGFTGEEIAEIFRQYEAVDEEKLFENLAYFLERVVPVAEEAGVYLAIHPDDPPWPIFGLPRIIGNSEQIQRVLDIVDSPHNGLTFCSGSLGTRADNDLPQMVQRFGSRINFVHLRNVKRTGERDFYEVAHPSEFGDVDMAALVQALIDIGYDGPARSDHGREIWGEVIPRTGYGLYDRALGSMYLYGLWQGLQK